MTKDDILDRLIHEVSVTLGTISIHPQLLIPLQELNIKVSYDVEAVHDLMMMSNNPTSDISIEIAESIRTILTQELNKK
jgi:hypothetical protein